MTYAVFNQEKPFAFYVDGVDAAIKANIVVLWKAFWDCWGTTWWMTGKETFSACNAKSNSSTQQLCKCAKQKQNLQPSFLNFAGVCLVSARIFHPQDK